MRKWLVFGAVLAWVMAIASFDVSAQASAVVEFDIPRQPLEAALRKVAATQNLQIIFTPNDVRGVMTQGLKGRFTAVEAVQKLLEGTGLNSVYDGNNSIAVKPKGEPIRTPPVSMGPSTIASSAVPQEKITVTAQKRTELLVDVPVPVTALDAERLATNNQTRLQDYYNQVPGLSLTMLGSTGNPVIVIRGLTTGGFVNPTAGIVVDDIPFGPSALAGAVSSYIASDFDPSDLARVEILRGPQGTLYGANSIGGLIKYVTLDPTTDRVGGRVQVGLSRVESGDDTGYAVRGGVNVPITDSLALRVSGSTRFDPGYVDNIQTSQRDLNSTDTRTMRVGALWRPNSSLAVKLSALYQSANRDGPADTYLPSAPGPQTTLVSGRPDLGDLQQSSLINTGWYEQTFQAYSSTVTANVGRAELTSLTGYSVSRLVESIDQSVFFRTPTLSQFGVGGYEAVVDAQTKKFTQELRLSMPFGNRLEWMLGGFYTREKFPGRQDSFAINTDTGAIAGTPLHIDVGGSYKEYAVFTNLLAQLTDRFDVQGGARHSRNRLVSGPLSQTTYVPGQPPQFSFNSATAASDSPTTYLFTPRFKITPDLMAYARFASGYRPGGANVSALTPAGIAAGVPRDFGADTAYTYEVGVKGELVDHRLAFDASIYHIDWKDVQVQLRDPRPEFVSLVYTLNAGRAKSDGVELSIEARPTQSLKVSAWAAYNNAKLTSVPTTRILTANPGDRLPYTPQWSGNVSFDQRVPVSSTVVGTFGATVRYVGDRMGRFFTGVPQGTFPAYTLVDLRGALSFGSWTVNAYVNNATDERGVLRSGRDSTLSLLYAVTYVQPRTFGINLTRTF